MAPCPPSEAEPIAYGQNIYGGNRPWTIGANTEYPELCMAIINWLATPEGRMTLEYGPKDVCWYYDEDGNVCRVGNSVSLRSKRLLDYPKKAGFEWKPAADGFYNEEIFLCCMTKVKIEKAGMKFAPIEVARLFGREHTIPETEGVTPFLFHKWWGENKDFPRFENPFTKIWLTMKAIRRKLMFWRDWS